MFSTLGDSVESFLYRLWLRLLQSVSFVLYGCGWCLERAGPYVLLSANKLRNYVELRLKEADDRPDYRSEVSRSDGCKSIPSKERKVEISKPPQPEGHPGEEESKIQIAQPSTDTSGIAVPEEVTQPDQSSEETSSDECPATIGDLIKSQIKHDERHLQ